MSGRTALLVVFAASLAPVAVTAQPVETRTAADSALVARVEAALEAASDVPADSLRVEASGDTVVIAGSVLCDDCGGTRTPGGTGTVQQSLGAVVRAVPGVEEVRFYLLYSRPEPPPR